MSEEQILEERLRAFAAAPGDGEDWEDVLRRAGGRRRVRVPRRRLALALAAAFVVAVVVGVLVTHGTRPGLTGLIGPSGPQGPPSTPTLEQPLHDRGARQVSLSAAARALGRAFVLPDTPQVGPSDVGSVWMNQLHGDETQTAVAVTFPSQDLIINYERPAPPDPFAYFQATTKETPNSKLIWLGSTPASYNPGSPDYWAAIEVIVGGATIGVLGHTSEASLQAVAQSIVDRATG